MIFSRHDMTLPSGGGVVPDGKIRTVSIFFAVRHDTP
jgi:hypothetical protein